MNWIGYKLSNLGIPRHGIYKVILHYIQTLQQEDEREEKEKTENSNGNIHRSFY